MSVGEIGVARNLLQALRGQARLPVRRLRHDRRRPRARRAHALARGIPLRLSLRPRRAGRARSLGRAAGPRAPDGDRDLAALSRAGGAPRDPGRARQRTDLGALVPALSPRGRLRREDARAHRALRDAVRRGRAPRRGARRAGRAGPRDRQHEVRPRARGAVSRRRAAARRRRRPAGARRRLDGGGRRGRRARRLAAPRPAAAARARAAPARALRRRRPPLRVARRARPAPLSHGPGLPARDARADVYLLDSIGELASVYREATLAFIGGSLVPRGGQNPIEAWAAGVPADRGPAHGELPRDRGVGARSSGILRAVGTPRLWRGASRRRSASPGDTRTPRSRGAAGSSPRTAARPSARPRRSWRFLPRGGGGIGAVIALAALRALREGPRAARRLYASGRLASRALPRPSISVGNLTFGGTGKTPFVEFLARRFRFDGWRPAILSRGYGRRSRGVVVVVAGEGPLVSADEGGDEPVALARATSGIIVVVGERRGDAARRAADLGADLFLLDDGFQHLAVRRDVNLLLLDARDPFGGGRLPPARTAARADRRGPPRRRLRLHARRPRRSAAGGARSSSRGSSPEAPVFHARIRPSGPSRRERLPARRRQPLRTPAASPSAAWPTPAQFARDLAAARLDPRGACSSSATTSATASGTSRGSGTPPSAPARAGSSRRRRTPSSSPAARALPLADGAPRRRGRRARLLLLPRLAAARRAGRQGGERRIGGEAVAPDGAGGPRATALELALFRAAAGSAARCFPRGAAAALGGALVRRTCICGRGRRGAAILLDNLRHAFPEKDAARDRAHRAGVGGVPRRGLRRVPAGLARCRPRRSATASASSARSTSGTRALRPRASSSSRRTSAAGSSAPPGRPGRRAHRVRRAPPRQPLPRGGARAAAHALRQPPHRQARRGPGHPAGACGTGETVAILVDQNVLPREAVFVPFFGRLAATTSSPSPSSS